jgi:hypothetical protein
MVILKLTRSNENKEIELELNYLMSLTTRQRFQMMFEKTHQMASLSKRSGRRKATKVVKRI